MKKLLLLLTAFGLMMLVACSSPEEDEVLKYHNGMVEEINPKLEEFDTLYAKIDPMAPDEAALDVYENELLPLLADIKEYYENQTLEYEVTKEYNELHIEFADAMYNAVEKEKEYVAAYLDDSVSQEEFDALGVELDKLNNIAMEKDKAVTDKVKSLKEEYNFEEE